LGNLYDRNVDAIAVQNQKALIIFPIILASYILWVYLKAKEKAEVKIQTQQGLLNEQNEQIKDSITYARRLQDAILPSNLNELLPDSFILFKPRDIVSGDFYWVEKTENGVYFAVADCTGHGVPGAMVSMVGNSGLNQVIFEKETVETNEILDELSDFVESTFTKTGENVKDGMDMSICRLNGSVLSFSGAQNPIYHVRDNKLNEYKGDKQPIGKHSNRSAFTKKEIELQKGDLIYLFSDGFADQFGGPKGKKFKYKAFKELLLKTQHESMNRQREILDEAIKDWMGRLEQLDDICVMGVRIN
jgi:serine phosphatase RsbU (regulator of sigma subunit)